MPRVVLKNGVLCPLEPLPPEWADGRELRVEDTEEPAAALDADDECFERLEAAAKQISPQDIEKLEAALKEADELAKAQMRREMGLPE